jgi:PKD repeat protein
MAEGTFFGTNAPNAPSAAAEYTAGAGATTGMAFTAAMSGLVIRGVRVYGTGSLVGESVSLRAYVPGVGSADLATAAPADQGIVTVVDGWNEVRFATPIPWDDTVRAVFAMRSVYGYYVACTIGAAAVPSPGGEFVLSAGSDPGQVPPTRAVKYYYDAFDEVYYNYDLTSQSYAIDPIVEVPPGSNQAPTAVLALDVASAGYYAQADFSGSSDPEDGTTGLTYAITWGDGLPAVVGTLDFAGYVYAQAGIYTVTLVVTDKDGASSIPVAQDIAINDPVPPPSPVLSAGPAPLTHKHGVDSWGLLVPRIDRYIINVSGPLTVGTLAERVWVHGVGKVKRITAVAEQGTFMDVAQVDFTIGGAVIDGPHPVNLVNRVDAILDEYVGWHYLGVDVTAVTGSVTNLEVTFWIEVTG